MTDDALSTALHIAGVFERMGLSYWLGGSLASSVHGEPRSTHDVDFVLDLAIERAAPLVKELEPDYHVSHEHVVDAVQRRESFQVVKKAEYYRVDVFIKKDTPFAEEEQRRRERLVVDPASGAALWITSAEDIVLQKLRWFQMGDCVSDRQWRDVISVLKTNPLLDRSYLDHWSDQLGIDSLLVKAISEAGQPGP